MPGGDGFAVLRAIKDLRPDTEVVVITGVSSVEHAKEAVRLGACDCLAKPVPRNNIGKAAVLGAIQTKVALRRIPGRDSAQPTREGESS